MKIVDKISVAQLKKMAQKMDGSLLKTDVDIAKRSSTTNYHTSSLDNAGSYTAMGSICVEVTRYDTAISSGNQDQAKQVAKRAHEIIDFAQNLAQIKPAQKLEITEFSNVFDGRVAIVAKSNLGDYLLPFAVAARVGQLR